MPFRWPPGLAKLDFADVRSKNGNRFYTFDDGKFARRAVKLAVLPEVMVP